MGEKQHYSPYFIFCDGCSNTKKYQNATSAPPDYSTLIRGGENKQTNKQKKSHPFGP